MASLALRQVKKAKHSETFLDSEFSPECRKPQQIRILGDLWNMVEAGEFCSEGRVCGSWSSSNRKMLPLMGHLQMINELEEKRKATGGKRINSKRRSSRLSKGFKHYLVDANINLS